MNIRNSDDLKLAIKVLENKSRLQEQMFLEKAHALRDSLKPANLIVNSLSSLTGIPINKSDFLNKGALLAVTYIIQRLLRKSEIKFENFIADFILDLKKKVKDFFSRDKYEESQDENFKED